MKKTCNYCRAYDSSGNCMLHYEQTKLSEQELDTLNIWPYGLVEARYYIKMKPAEPCPAPYTLREYFAFYNQAYEARKRRNQ